MATPQASILYIDDDDGLRRLAQRALERRGFRVALAASGPEGIARAGAERFDLVAVDHYMPGQDGLATLAELCELPDPPPVIYVTGSEESRIAVAALKAGAIDYVVKTVHDDFFDLLARAIDQALDAVQLRRERDEAEAQLVASNARLQTLLHEVNHRVANSLQLVSAFVHMQSRTLTDDTARDALDSTQRRIAAIAQVHKRLYTSDSIESVDMADYLDALVRDLGETWSVPGARRLLRLSADPIRLSTDRAVALGVIVTELVSNACKYAYPSGQEGEVRIALAADGPTGAMLSVEDDGRGLPGDGVPQGTGLGSKIIAAMADSLASRIGYTAHAPGVRAELRLALA